MGRKLDPNWTEESIVRNTEQLGKRNYSRVPEAVLVVKFESC